MAQNDIFQLTFVQQVNARRITNVFFYQQLSIDGPIDPKLSLANAFEGHVGAKYVNNLSVSWDALCEEVKLVTMTGQQFFRKLNVDGPGLILGNALNAATVAVIATFTPGGSHTGTGRTFISGLPQTYEERNNLNLAGLTAIDLIGDSLVPIINDSTVTFQCGRFNKLASPTFEPWVLSDVRVPLTKLRPRRQTTRC